MSSHSVFLFKANLCSRPIHYSRRPLSSARQGIREGARERMGLRTFRLNRPTRRLSLYPDFQFPCVIQKSL